MFLSDRDIRKLMDKNEIVDPFVPENCEGATIDLTLDVQIKKFKEEGHYRMGEKYSQDNLEKVDISKEAFYLQPNESVLVQSYEYLKIPNNFAGIVFERYSIKLLGLVVSPSSYMNPGYEGRLTFLMTNQSKTPIQLVSGLKFCQLSLSELTSEANYPYEKQDAKYMGSVEVQTSKIHLDKEIQTYLQENGHKDSSIKHARELSEFLMERMDEKADEYVNQIKEKMEL
ncbi:dCTP deaminase [Gracilibacillus sp. YIM 98692]|uniref:dCTP deaminase n=1 Tax=Gracilibacillus sp. YIM 98692 TaxID=2663532 RepID=UPI0013D0E0B4|nr:dCTP deaminase [Gracilibacillus sp. YIM 98692]